MMMKPLKLIFGLNLILIMEISAMKKVLTDGLLAKREIKVREGTLSKFLVYNINGWQNNAKKSVYILSK